jgi:signal peptidase I
MSNPTDKKQNSQKSPGLAAFLSFILPGAGHVYADNIKKGLLFNITFWLVLFSLRFIAVTFTALVAGLILLPLYSIYIMRDAYRTIKRNPQEKTGEKNKWHLYFLMVVINAGLLRMPSDTLNKYSSLIFFHVPTEAMEPSLLVGDYFVAKRTKNIQHNDITVFIYPVDQQTYYIKRCIGLPGDSVEIKNDSAYVNHTIVDNPSQLKFGYIITTDGSEINPVFFEERDITQINRNGSGDYIIMLTPDQAKEVSAIPTVKNIERANMPGDGMMFPNGVYTGWSAGNYGPIYIPKKRVEIKLTIENVKFYSGVLHSENNNCTIDNDTIVKINNQIISTYTFKENYFFVLGDNRHNSLDSRYWGFVAEKFITGKALYLYWSKSMSRIGNGVQ